jgi:murein DD-endopeptidase MepM/ murein hydrolase activator NlpD
MTTTIVSAVLLFSLLATDVHAEPPEYYFIPEEVHQGDIINVIVRLSPGAKTGSLSFRGYEHAGFLTGGLLNALVGIDLDTEPGDYLVSYAFDNGDRGELPMKVLPREFGRESLTVDAKYTELDKEASERSENESKQLNEIWSRSTPERLWRGAFVKPTRGDLGSPFGLRRYFNDKPRSPHSGVDIKAPLGEPIYASNYGKIVLARDLFFTGNTIVIDHGAGLYTIYAHLSKMEIEEGVEVERAQRIGQVGATGRATGPHLHWAVKLGGARVDPAKLPGAML